MKFNISTNRVSADRAFDSQHDVTDCIFDGITRLADRPLLLNRTDNSAWRSGHLHTLQPARAPTRIARQRPVNVNDLKINKLQTPITAK